MAVAIYRDLAAINNLDGLYHLGHCYQYGHGVEKDLAEAERLYRKAIELGDVRAEIQLNDMLHPKKAIDEDESENAEAKPSKHPIGKKLIICLLTTTILATVFINCRVQPWLLMPYLFLLIIFPFAALIIHHRMKKLFLMEV